MVWYVRCSLVRHMVCEVFTCSTCGLVCVRCSLVHLVLWCVRCVHLLTFWYCVCEVNTCSPCGVVSMRCSPHVVVCEVFTCSTCGG